MRLRRMRQLVFFGCITTLLAVSPSPTLAQNGRELIGGLLRDLIESEIDRQQQKQPGLRRSAPGGQPSANARQARTYFGQFRDESQQLANHLQRDARRIPGVRSHLDEVLRLRARTELLNQRYATPQSDATLRQDIQSLDRDWRMAAYHLNQLRDLPDPCRQSIRRLDDINQRCCGLFDIGPQFDRRDVVRLADALVAELHHLQRDVEFELRSNTKSRPLLLQLSRLEARAKLLSDSAADGDAFEVVVAEYRRVYNDWNGLSRRLESINDRHIDRTVDQIHEIHRALHEHLLLEVVVDRGRLQHLARQTQHRIEALSDAFSLALLAQIPEGQTLLESARIVFAESEYLVEAIARNAANDELCDHWQALAAGWREFSVCSQPIDSPRIRGLRREIDSMIDAMRQDLGVQIAFDRRTVLRVAAELEGIAQQTQFHVEQWRRRPGARVDDATIDRARRFAKDCRRLHEDCAARGVEREQLGRSCQRIANDWTQLRPGLLRCNTIDQSALRRVSDQATARLVRLQVMLER